MGMINVITVTVVSDANGIVNVNKMDGYTYITGNAYANNSTQPLELLRVGDYVYTGYYGSATTPAVGTPSTLLFTPVANCEVNLFYTKK